MPLVLSDADVLTRSFSLSVLLSSYKSALGECLYDVRIESKGGGVPKALMKNKSTTQQAGAVKVLKSCPQRK